ncbi:phage terminase small subunit [Novosphingobium sp. P6W]|uniref:phage terminase small subunit n=1 Tax=Novosphingobium sp. P6W TaxID=1609758 RepID=UPI0005C306FC|nr:phage terminase small subunit [Novosphingobium sp. P6W]AXB75482.1 terminase [Novosphingobium sp. P6W]KIS32494.1 terminase [Novosphingobium sp. P6W]
MSLARRKRDRILAAQTISAAAAPVRRAALAPAAAILVAAGANTASPAERAAREIALRLTHDLRRLKEIRSIDKKIAAKREMLPEYKAWVDGVLSAAAGVGTGLAADVVPTYMVWLLDTGDYMPALDVAEFLLRHRVEMPARYARDVPTIIVELIADAAAKAQNASQSFDPAVLDTADNLTAGLDIHDQVRAKLHKAIGIEQLRKAEDMPAVDSRIVLESALFHLRDAQRLNDRVGVKDRVKRAEKLLAAVVPIATEANTEQGGTAA